MDTREISATHLSLRDFFLYLIKSVGFSINKDSNECIKGVIINNGKKEFSLSF
jgi:hypothetical protein